MITYDLRGVAKICLRVHRDCTNIKVIKIDYSAARRDLNLYNPTIKEINETYTLGFIFNETR